MKKLGACCFLLYFLALAAAAQADDSGYFLSWTQKSQLIADGKIEDSRGQVYDIWIVPGYWPPARYARRYFFETGGDFPVTRLLKPAPISLAAAAPLRESAGAPPS